MAHLPKQTQQIEEMRRKLQSLQASLNELGATIDLMEKSGISSIETSHVGQMDRAIDYALKYATGARRAYLQKLHSKP